MRFCLEKKPKSTRHKTTTKGKGEEERGTVTPWIALLHVLIFGFHNPLEKAIGTPCSYQRLSNNTPDHRNSQPYERSKLNPLSIYWLCIMGTYS